MSYRIDYLRGGALKASETHPGPINAACAHAGKNLKAREADAARIIDAQSLAEAKLVKSDGDDGYVVG
jgi:hypothetical protein